MTLFAFIVISFLQQARSADDIASLLVTTAADSSFQSSQDSEGFTFTSGGTENNPSPSYVALTELEFPEVPALIPAVVSASNSTTVGARTTSSKVYGLDFEFRTPQSNVFLMRRWVRGRQLYPSIMRHDDVMMRRNRFARKWESAEPEVELLVWLKIGMLYVTVSKGGSTVVSLSVSRDLDDDHWHKAAIFIDDVAGRLNASVDGKEHKSVALLTADVTGFEPRYYLAPFFQPALISLGGLSSSIDRSSVKSLSGEFFVGCIRNVAPSVDALPVPVRLADRSPTAERGCRDLCGRPGDVCKNGGRCLNHYVSVYCDCYGTGFEGPYCERKDQRTVTLHGTDWLMFMPTYVNNDDNDQHHQTSKSHGHLSMTRIALQFKTPNGDGVLFHSSQQVSTHGLLELTLSNATLHVAMTTVNQAVYSELLVYLGNRLDDNRWHNVLVIQRDSTIDVSLDGHVERMTLEHAYWRFRLPSSVYFGGLRKGHKSFVGCLREIYFNDVNVLERLRVAVGPTPVNGDDDNHRQQHPQQLSWQGQGRTAYRDSVWHYRTVQLNGCGSGPDGPSSRSLLPLYFVWPGATVTVELHQFRLLEDSLTLRLAFKTFKPDCLLAWNEIGSGPVSGLKTAGNASSRVGAVEMSLKGGRLAATIMTSSAPFNDSRRQHQQVVFVGTELHDGVWHTVRVSIQNGFAEVEVDQLRRVEFVSTDLQFKRVVQFGIAPHLNATDGFVGSLRSIKIQNVVIDPMKLIHSPSTFGVTLGSSSDDVTWCHHPSSVTCHRNSNCVNNTTFDGVLTGPSCDCGDLSRRQFCSFYAFMPSLAVLSKHMHNNGTHGGKKSPPAFHEYQLVKTDDELLNFDNLSTRQQLGFKVVIAVVSALSAVSVVFGCVLIAIHSVRQRRRIRFSQQPDEHVDQPDNDLDPFEDSPQHSYVSSSTSLSSISSAAAAVISSSGRHRYSAVSKPADDDERRIKSRSSSAFRACSRSNRQSAAAVTAANTHSCHDVTNEDLPISSTAVVADDVFHAVDSTTTSSRHAAPAVAVGARRSSAVSNAAPPGVSIGRRSLKIRDVISGGQHRRSTTVDSEYTPMLCHDDQDNFSGSDHTSCLQSDYFHEFS